MSDSLEQATLTPLELAQAAAKAVDAYDRILASDDPGTQMQAYTGHVGERRANAAVLAGNLALVSIAEDLHFMTEILRADMAE